MKRASVIFLLVFISATMLGACVGKKRMYKDRLGLEKTIEFRPRRLPGGGAPNEHPCIQGNYYHRYETENGMHGYEVWLCCVPVNEVLSDSFGCDGSFLALPHIGNSDYMKIRYCALLHPTETELTYIPVCIPAPLVAPGTDQ